MLKKVEICTCSSSSFSLVDDTRLFQAYRQERERSPLGLLDKTSMRGHANIGRIENRAPWLSPRNSDLVAQMEDGPIGCPSKNSTAMDLNIGWG